MRRKILEKNIKKSINKSVQGRISKKLDKLKKDTPDWNINYKWNRKGNRLEVGGGKLCGEVIFLKRKVEVFVELPFYLLPVLEPFRKKTIEIFEEEISELLT